MNFAVLGGDERSVCLVGRLRQDGHEVHTFGMECSPSHQEKHTGLEEALAGAECVVLPVPLSVKPGFLNAPFGETEHRLEEIISRIPVGVPVFAGAVGGEAAALAEERGIVITDLLAIEELAVKNAALTAEGAVGVLIRETDHCLMGWDVLIIGAGRIGKLLGLRLKALGANVTVSARTESDKAWCRGMCLGAADTGELELILPKFSVVVNTVPSPVLPAGRLRCLPKDALILELASKPGGVDQTAARTLGVRVVTAGGLPGKTAPNSAASAIADTIYHHLVKPGD